MAGRWRIIRAASMDTFELFDRIPLDSVKLDGAGNLIAAPRVARVGIYKYAGYELGRPEMREVRVFRPPDEVFNRDTMRSLAGVPVTIDHPRELVTTENWADHAKGETASDDIVRDGEAVRVPFILRDANAIKIAQDQKHELSPGYTALIDWTAGEDEQFGAYDAVARGIRYNHLAIVDKARGGSSCRIGDGEPEDEKVSNKQILVDGFSVEVTDQAEAAINKLLDQRKSLTDELGETKTKLADAEKAKGTLEGEKAALEKQLKDATDPAALQKAAADRASLCDKAKALVPAIVTDGKTDDEIRKEVVTTKLGDAAAALTTDDAINGAFATLAAGVKVRGKGDGKDTLRDAISETAVADDDIASLTSARDKAREKYVGRLHDAHNASGKNEE